MKSVLISIQPYWVFLIIAKVMGWNTNEEKTIEVRKNHPKDKCWDKVAKIYCSKDKKSFAKIPKEYQPFMEKFLGKVIGEFVCDEVYPIKVYSNCAIQNWMLYKLSRACLTLDEVAKYIGANKTGYGWHISDLVIYDKPKELSEFYTVCKLNCEYCEMWGSVRVNAEEFDMDCKSDWFNHKPLTRPFQSWGYVYEAD